MKSNYIFTLFFFWFYHVENAFLVNMNQKTLTKVHILQLPLVQSIVLKTVHVKNIFVRGKCQFSSSANVWNLCYFFFFSSSGGVLTPGWSHFCRRSVSFCRPKRLQQCWNEAESSCWGFHSRTTSEQSRGSFPRAAAPSSPRVAGLCVGAAGHQPQPDTEPSPAAAAHSPFSPPFIPGERLA